LSSSRRGDQPYPQDLLDGFVLLVELSGADRLTSSARSSSRGDGRVRTLPQNHPARPSNVRPAVQWSIGCPRLGWERKGSADALGRVGTGRQKRTWHRRSDQEKSDRAARWHTRGHDRSRARNAWLRVVRAGGCFRGPLRLLRVIEPSCRGRLVSPV
jgi:hypothetical protein